ncbi:protein yippee-like 4, partial [Anas acuta]
RHGDVTRGGDESRGRDAVPGRAVPPPPPPPPPSIPTPLLPPGDSTGDGDTGDSGDIGDSGRRPFSPWGGRGTGGKTALSTLLRCFPCQRLCGGCTVPPAPPRPPGALPPSVPPPPARRHLPPAACLPPRTFHSYLPRSHRTYSCVHCRAHLARHEELISKSFQGSHGRAYLFNSVVNVGCGPAEQRLLLTGLHSVADIFCESCKTTLGWKYEQAFESSQKYKEGKFIIETSHMVKENGWD